MWRRTASGDMERCVNAKLTPAGIPAWVEREPAGARHRQNEPRVDAIGAMQPCRERCVSTGGAILECARTEAPVARDFPAERRQSPASRVSSSRYSPSFDTPESISTNPCAR